MTIERLIGRGVSVTVHGARLVRAGVVAPGAQAAVDVYAARDYFNAGGRRYRSEYVACPAGRCDSGRRILAAWAAGLEVNDANTD